MDILLPINPKTEVYIFHVHTHPTITFNKYTYVLRRGHICSCFVMEETYDQWPMEENFFGFDANFESISIGACMVLEALLCILWELIW